MSVRFSKNVGSETGVESGYRKPDASHEINVPSCGIMDVDRALFDLFNEEIGFQSNIDENGKITGNVPVIFGTGERWALAKKGIPRDKVGTAILPLITIKRGSVTQDPTTDITGRGINQQTGELVVKRKLSSRDRTYQNLINKSDIPNADYSNSLNHIDASFRTTHEDKDDLTVRDGALIDSGKNGSTLKHNNVWEFITIPSPQFFTSKYTVTVWCQYMKQINSLVQKIMSSMLPQGRSFRLETKKGYWFVANIVSDFTFEDNIDDMLNSERILRCSFDVEVPGYVVASREPGQPSPIRKYVSAPFITFDVVEDQEVNVLSDNKASDRIDHSSDPTSGFKLDGDLIARTEDTRTVEKPEFGYVERLNVKTNSMEKIPVRVVSKNAKGESILRPIDRYLGTTIEILR